MYRRRLGVFALFLFFSSCSTKTPVGFKLLWEAEPFPGLKMVQYEHSKSGLKVLLVPQEKSDVVAYVTSFDVGSRFEMKGQTGLAHLFEHMMFRGTPSFPKPFETLADWGGESNAFTSFDITQYYEVIPKELLEKVVHFESERMRKLLITEEVFNTERGAVVSERKMNYMDRPIGQLYWELYNTAYDKHSYKILTIGLQEDLDRATLQDALDFYRRYYAPNRAQLVIVGGFEVKPLLKLIEKYYGKFEREEVVEPNVPQEPLRKDFRRRVFKNNTQSVLMVDAWLGYDYKNPNVPAASLMCQLYANGSIGYLYYKLVETKIARSVSGGCDSDIDPGLDTIIVTGNPGVSLEKIERAYDQARSGFLSWLNEDRLEKLKLYYIGGKWSELRSPLGIANDLARSAIIQRDPLYSYKFIEDIKKVTLNDITREFNRPRYNRTRIFVVPNK